MKRLSGSVHPRRVSAALLGFPALYRAELGGLHYLKCVWASAQHVGLSSAHTHQYGNSIWPTAATTGGLLTPAHGHREMGGKGGKALSLFTNTDLGAGCLNHMRPESLRLVVLIVGIRPGGRACEGEGHYEENGGSEVEALHAGLQALGEERFHSAPAGCHLGASSGSCPG